MFKTERRKLMICKSYSAGPGDIVDLGYHEGHLTILSVEGGNDTLRFENSSGSHTVSCNDIVITDSEDDTFIKVSEHVMVETLVFDKQIVFNSHLMSMGIEIPDLPKQDGCSIISYDPDDGAFAEMRSLIKTISERSGLYDAAENMLTLSMIWQLVYLIDKLRVKEDHKACSFRRSRNVERMRPVMEYIEENYNNRISLSDLAVAANMSVPNLCAVFRDTYNISPMSYLRRYRLDNSLRLLKVTNRKIIDIAEECGFFSISNYIKVFRKHLGMSPSEFRKSNVA